MRRGRTLAAVAALAMAVLGLAGCGESSEVGTGAAGGTLAVGAVYATDDPSPDPAEEVVVTHERVRKNIKLRYQTVHRKTATLKKGVTKVARPGRPGLRVKVFRITYEDGVWVDRELVVDKVKRKPVSRIVLHGTKVIKPQPQPGGRCDPNYSGCVPIASDVDCAGGSGDGPAYVRGPVRVIGSDIYGLDADGDGWGCD
ncbi:G5 domain-containing protein [Nocardioides soli]|uniref:G5 domain-containing protein n=1 Tax=Nocardioides soli TaxID=1036020 RepID=A0A7W4VSW0_9ACTN|nr:hypothetical protein [Nocardioides soli]